MKKQIIAQDKDHLKYLIVKEIVENGIECDLNHINVSHITEMGTLFQFSKFNGNISEWDVSNVKDMSGMFHFSKFNGDLSKWNVSNVKSMYDMFRHSTFNNDISNWNISNVKNMCAMFSSSQFNSDISNWKPLALEFTKEIFLNSKLIDLPFWAGFDDNELKGGAVNFYLDRLELQEKLLNELENKGLDSKKVKI